MNIGLHPKNTFLFIACAIISLPLLISCDENPGNEKPPNLIPEDTYIDVLVEFQLIRTYGIAHPDSVNADSLSQVIFEKYEIDEDQFLSSHQFYQKQVENQLKRTDEAIQRLEKEEDRMAARIDSLKVEKARADSLQADTSLVDTTRKDILRPDTSRIDTTSNNKILQ
ncbi:MAG: DUF4296 domain-containing protein [Balneolaceae bacterium]